MEDIAVMADRALSQICKERDLKPSEEIKIGFRLGFLSGRVHEMDRTLKLLSPEKSES